jgi:hypothetical protein
MSTYAVPPDLAGFESVKAFQQYEAAGVTVSSVALPIDDIRVSVARQHAFEINLSHPC